MPAGSCTPSTAYRAETARDPGSSRRRRRAPENTRWRRRPAPRRRSQPARGDYALHSRGSRRDTHVRLGGQVQRVLVDAIGELEGSRARREVGDAKRLRERFPSRVNGLRVREAGGVITSDRESAGGAVRVEAPRGLARARGAVLGEEVENASPGAYDAGRNRSSARARGAAHGPE